MKRFLASLLILALMLTFAGCGYSDSDISMDHINDYFGVNEAETQPVEQHETTEATIAATEDPVPSEEESSVETIQPTEETIPEVTVSDAFVETLTVEEYNGPETYCYHIPKFNMDTPAAEALNEKIYSKLYAILEDDVYADPNQPFCFGMSYRLVQKENIASLLVYMPMNWGLVLFYAFHIYADGSAEVSNEALWNFYGYDESSFYALAERKMEEKFIALYADFPGVENDPYYEVQWENTIAEENVRDVEPYISSNGDLCCIARIYAMAGGDSYFHLVNLSGTAKPAYPSCEIDHS